MEVLWSWIPHLSTEYCLLPPLPSLSSLPLPSRQVTVNVIDINDNTPEFSESTYETVVVENATTGETVLIVMATDDDTGSNGQVTYQFQSLISKWMCQSCNTFINHVFFALPPPPTLQVRFPLTVGQV